ncbi:MAG TPA: hotdog domain-containing protein [Terriglobales bacterium]|nr:hotdog domain-containing protein [Terriglobales bacterium]
MSKQVPLGAHGEAEQRVEFKHTLTHWNAELPEVYSTPHMIGLMETAAYHALQPYLDSGEISVGTAINIEHRDSATIGALVKAEAELESFDGRFFVFRVSARAVNHAGEREIGRGTVSRAIVHLERMKKKLQK